MEARAKYGLSGELRQTLYNSIYSKIKKSSINVEFDSFDDFSKWAAETGYQYGYLLRRMDTQGPYSPDNCYWLDKKSTSIDAERAKQWDDFITPIRERFAPYLAEVSQKQKEEKQSKVQYFWYEHPDLVREGIVFECSNLA